MRGFILGGLIASVVWVFVTLGGAAKISQAWAEFELASKVAAAEGLAKERETAFAENYRPDHGCHAPSSELKRLECRNRIDMARSSYYAQWNRANTDRFPK